MKQKIVCLLVVCNAFAFTGCSGTVGTTDVTVGNKNVPVTVGTSVKTAASTPSTPAEAVPAWLLEAIQSKIGPNFDLKPYMITFCQVNLTRTTDSPQIAAYVNLWPTAFFLLFDRGSDGTYSEVYELSEEVESMQVYGGGQQVLVLSSGHHGTGILKRNYHVIRAQDGAFFDSWSGMAVDVNANGPGPYFDNSGAVVIGQNFNRLNYFSTERTYDKLQPNGDFPAPSTVKNQQAEYKYDADQKKYVPVNS